MYEENVNTTLDKDDGKSSEGLPPPPPSRLDYISQTYFAKREPQDFKKEDACFERH